MVSNINDFYLNTEMERYEYMKLWLNIISEEIIEQYSLRYLENNGWVFIEIKQMMYCLL